MLNFKHHLAPAVFIATLSSLHPLDAIAEDGGDDRHGEAVDSPLDDVCEDDPDVDVSPDDIETSLDVHTTICMIPGTKTPQAKASFEVESGEISEPLLKAALDQTLGRVDSCHPASLTTDSEDVPPVTGSITVELTLRDQDDWGTFTARITSVKILDSDFDDDDEARACLQEKLEESSFRFPPPLKDYPAVIVDVTYEF